jgi:cysteinyl-tRNA synthetase
VNYRKPLNFTWEGMEEARESLGRIDDWLERLREIADEENAQRRTPNAQRPIEESGFENALDDDLNISAALGVLFETIRETNRAMDQDALDAASANAWLTWWKRINTVLDLEKEGEKIPADIMKLVGERESARAAKDWKKSDELRDKIVALGWEVRDTEDGPKLTQRGSG